MSYSPDSKTPEGQLRICHDESAAALATLARINLVLQRDQDGMPDLMAMMISAKEQVGAAHDALRNFSGLLLPCAGSS